MVYHHTIVAPSHGNLIIEYVNKLKSLSSKLIPHISISKLLIPAFASNMLVHLCEAKKKSSIL